MVSKHSMEIIFQHIMNDKLFMVAGVGRLQLNANSKQSPYCLGWQLPSCSIPGYVCQWLLEKKWIKQRIAPTLTLTAK